MSSYYTMLRKTKNAHLASTFKGKYMGKKKKDKEATDKEPQKRWLKRKKKDNLEGSNCFFCRVGGHKKNHYTSYHAWPTKEGVLLNLICSEDTLTLVPRYTWWIDSSETTHTRVSMQGCLNCQKPSNGERYVNVAMARRLKLKQLENLYYY